MHDEPPMPADAQGIAEWLKHPAVIMRIRRDQVAAHGPHWREMAIEAIARDRQRPRPPTAARRLRSTLAYLRMRVGETLTGLDKQALSQVLRAGIAVIAYANVLDRAQSFMAISEIDAALKMGSGPRQDRLIATLSAEGETILEGDPSKGQPTSDPAPIFLNHGEMQNEPILETAVEDVRSPGSR